MEIFGWFDTPSQDKPTYDPGLEAICPFCLLMLERPVVTLSLMKDGDNKSYFYRAHKHCYDAASDDERNQIEWSLIDS